MVVSLTEKAAGEIKRVMSEQKMDPTTTMVRIGVAGGGCSGFSYAFGFDTKFSEAEDAKFDCNGVPLVVDRRSALFLEGTVVDFYEGLEARGFKFENPNAVKTCGCGSSFQA